MADSTLTLLNTKEPYQTIKLVEISSGVYALAVTSVGASGASVTKAEDAPHVSGDLVTPAGVVRKDTAASIAGTDGDYTLLQVDATGFLRVTGTFVLAEDAVHASGDPGVQILSVRKDSAAALAGADGDYQPVITDSAGRVWARLPGSDVTNNLLKTAEINTAGSLVAADGASIAGVGVLAKLIVSNNHATEVLDLSVYDNSSAAGTKLLPDMVIPAQTQREFSPNVPFSIGVWLEKGATGTMSAIAYYKVAV